MEISTVFPLESLSATQFSTASENRRRPEKSTQPEGDTVSLSPEALELARQNRLAAFCGAYGTDKLDEAEGDATTEDKPVSATEQYRSHFNEYRGMGLFAASEQTGEASSGQAAHGAAGSGASSSEDSDNLTAKLERQLKDLTRELEEVMASDVPDVQKEASAQELQKKISELQSRLTALKRGERMAGSAERG